MKKPTNMTELRDFCLDSMVKLQNKQIDAKVAKATAALGMVVLGSIRVELMLGRQFDHNGKQRNGNHKGIKAKEKESFKVIAS